MDKEERARYNWRKVMTMLQLVKAVCKMERDEMQNIMKDLDDEDETKVSCFQLKWVDKYVQPPNQLVMTAWTLLALTVNSISIFFVYYECAFRLRAFKSFSSLQMIFDVVLTLEMVIHFFKAYSSKESYRGWIHPVFKFMGTCKEKISKDDLEHSQWETSFRLIGIRYLSGQFIFDFLSVIPFFIAKLVNLNVDYQDFVHMDGVAFLSYLRLLRIT